MKENGTRALVDRLVAIQRAEGMADGEMAQRIGISRVMWSYVRRGIYPLSLRTMQKVAAAFPRLRPEVQAAIGI